LLSLRSALAAYWSLDEAAHAVRRDAVHGLGLYEYDFDGGTPSVNQTTGVIGHAAQFEDDQNFCLWSSELPDLSAGDFTLACWFWFTPNTYDGQALVSIGGTVWIGARAFDDAVNFGIATDNEDGYAQIQTDDGSVSENTRTHLVAVKHGGTLLIYLNGVARATGPFTGAVVPSVATGRFNATDLVVGCNPWGYPLNGAIDELGCWQRALSAAEATQLYNFGAGLPFDWF
jgi:hypothetical protein